MILVIMLVSNTYLVYVVRDFQLRNIHPVDN